MSQGSTQPLCVHKVKVSFDGEPGEGSGVLRSLFTAAAEVRCSDFKTFMCDNRYVDIHVLVVISCLVFLRPLFQKSPFPLLISLEEELLPAMEVEGKHPNQKTRTKTSKGKPKAMENSPLNCTLRESLISCESIS